MSIRKRTWQTKAGKTESWVVDYVDQSGKRNVKQFARRKDAAEFRDQAGVDIRNGQHVPTHKDITVAKAAEHWLARADAELEPLTAKGYRQHVDLHIVPYIGATKLSRLGIPEVHAFVDRLKAAGKSDTLIRSVRTSLSGILSEAQARGHSIRNAVKDMPTRRENKLAKRRKAKLQVGVDIPSPDDIRTLQAQLDKTGGVHRALVLTAIFTGMRASELRGLEWADVDFETNRIHVRQRANLSGTIGRPKSEKSERFIPMFPMVANILRDWRQQCPRDRQGALLYAFPSQRGTIQRHENIVRDSLCRQQIKAGLTKLKPRRDKHLKPVIGKDGKQEMITVAKYEGMHALRHWFASWCISPKARGGRGLTPKEAQELLGHASIMLTLDTYSHLFESTVTETEMAQAEAALLNVAGSNGATMP
ncbi:MAG: site-specific integrase [Mesorhizobium sp.]|nr:site-specific integrase [Mesorhizobium sp.]MBL8576350.1 site-specific integrase [Mesorhizobium sp.]